MTVWGLGFLEFDPGSLQLVRDFSAMTQVRQPLRQWQGGAIYSTRGGWAVAELPLSMLPQLHAGRCIQPQAEASSNSC